MSDELRNRVSAEIAKTGFPLELRVAALLRDRAYHVAHSVYYVDRDEEKGREVDLRALKNSFFRKAGRSYAVRHCLVLECKKSVARPWVVFSSPRASYDQNAGDIHGSGFKGGVWYRGGYKQWLAFEGTHPWFSYPLRGRSLYEPFASGSDGAANAFKAAISAVKAGIEVRRSGFAAGYGETQPNIAFYYPLVVLDGILFSAVLKAGDIVVEEVDAIPLSLNYRSPAYAEEERHTVLIVRESAFPAAIEALDGWLQSCASHLEKHPSVFEAHQRRKRKASGKRDA